VPLAWLATPIRHPLYNLLFQAGVTIWLGLMAPALVARAAGFRREATAAGTLVAILLVALLGRFRLYDLLWVQPYASSLCLGALGLLGLGSRVRIVRLVGVICLLLGHYINLALVLPLLPLVILRPVDRRERALAVAVILSCFAASLAASRLADAPHESYGPRPIGEWLGAYLGLARAFLAKVPDRMWVGCLALIAAGAIGGRLVPKTDRGRLMASAGVLTAAAAGHFLALAPSRHIVVDSLACKYSYMSFLLLLVAVVARGLGPWLARRDERGRRRLEWGFLGALVAVAAIRFGPPSLSGVTRGLRAHSGAVARDVVENRASFVIGTYWKVYPALFLANLDRYESGHREPIWGITEKAGATRLLWRRAFGRGERYAALPGDEKAARFFMQFCRLPPLVPVAGTQDIRLFREASDVTSPAATAGPIGYRGTTAPFARCSPGTSTMVASPAVRGPWSYCTRDCGP
jgi:hypothetical protein